MATTRAEYSTSVTKGGLLVTSFLTMWWFSSGFQCIAPGSMGKYPSY
ncbi:hypothetical protein MUA04_06510 [Enterobacteriaceae bacterium H11S18]|nr:hypothetical protein [Dryocola clanedunensis]MCT4709834.1 hypothetical protein [Dryocola clanedunensis]